VSRENVESVLEEQKFQLSGATEKAIAEAGQLLGAQKVFVGSVGKVGFNYLLNLKSVDVKSGRIEQAEREECPSENLLSAATFNLANKIAGLPTKPLSEIEASVPSAFDLRTKGSAFGVKFTGEWGDGSFGMIPGVTLKTFIDARKGLEIGLVFMPGNIVLADFDVAFHRPGRFSFYYGYGGNFLYTFGPNSASAYNLSLSGNSLGIGLHAKGGVEAFLGKFGIFIEGTTGYMYGYDNTTASGTGYFFYSLATGARLYFSGFSVF